MKRAAYYLLSLLAAGWGCASPAPTRPPAAPASPPGRVLLAGGRAAGDLAFPAVFEAAFLSGTTIRQDSTTLACSRQEPGQLRSETGRLLAGDPITVAGQQAFTQRFPVGEFPVQLALLRFGADQRVGFARVLFDTARVARWQLALRPGQAPLALRDSTFYCYGVDGGLGTFLDSVANQALAARPAGAWEQAFFKPAERPDFTGNIYRFDGHNIATFTTGLGDGCYPTYIGYGVRGQVCRLLTDFRMVSW